MYERSVETTFQTKRKESLTVKFLDFGKYQMPETCIFISDQVRAFWKTHLNLYMHIDKIEQATAITILYEANKISTKFLAKAVEHIESVKKEVQENDEYEAIRDMAEEKLKPYLLAVAVKMAKFVDVPEFKIEINIKETVPLLHQMIL